MRNKYLHGFARTTAALLVLSSSACTAPGDKRSEGPDTGDGDSELTPLTDDELLRVRIRRLTSAEYEASVRSLVPTSQGLTSDFPPDSRQGGYTRNHLQTIDSVLAEMYRSTASNVASEAVTAGLPMIAPCASTDSEETCANQFVTEFGARAYRRALEATEVADLMNVYRTGATEVGVVRGIALALGAILQSAGFLYVTEIGGEPEGTRATLPGDEIAAQLSYLLVGAPPDAALTDAARDGLLLDPEERRAQAWRLLQNDQSQAIRMIEEWLGIDALAKLGKDESVFPEFPELRESILGEASSFIGAVLRQHGASLSTLLTADFSFLDAPLAAHYEVPYPDGATGPQEVSLASTGRRGILTQAAFLSVHAHADSTSPVLRGVTVLRRLLCVDLPDPAELNIMVTVPLPDPDLTTRERFESHVADEQCAVCHKFIDPAGFPFEAFGAIGEPRSIENGVPVDTTGALVGGTDLDGPVDDAAELVTKLAGTEEVRRCFARQVFRYASAGGSEAAEDAFVRRWELLGPEQKDNMAEVLVAFVTSEQFIVRRTP